MIYLRNPPTFYEKLREMTEQTKGIKYETFVTKLFNDMGDMKDALMHSAVGASTESGELLDAVKRVKFYNKPIDLQNMVEELGDLRFYYEAMLQMLSITDAEIQAANMIKLKARYPEGRYTDHHANARLDKEVSPD